MNFGPLNREGGWRRLNVAVSRARNEMTVYSTLTPDQINLSKTNAAGVAALKLFLEYASGRELPQDENIVLQSRQDKEGIVHSICKMLEENGYQTDCSVGHSKYKIDIGIIDPNDPSGYLCGILLDGDTYETAKTTRDREIAQISVLNNLGWIILRVWTMDWWDNRKKELKKILQFVKNTEGGIVPIVEEKEEEPANTILETITESEEPVSRSEPLFSENAKKPDAFYTEPQNVEMPVLVDYKATALSNYSVTPEDFVTNWYDKQIVTTIYRVLMQEAPICESMLIRRVVQSFGIARSGSRIQEKMNSLLSTLQLQRNKKNGKVVYWWDNQIPSKYNMIRTSGEGVNKRDAKEVPVEEVVNAIIYVLTEQISLSEEDLIREAAKLLGYTRIGNIVEFLVYEGINEASSTGKICRGINSKWKLSDK